MTTAELNHQSETDITSGFTTAKRFSGEAPEKEDVFDVMSLGKGLVLEYERKVDFNKNLANKFLLLPNVSYERKLEDKHVEYLMTTMYRGTFRPELVRLTSCTCGKATGDQPPSTEFRMNGQHTCWAMVEMPEEYACPDKVTVARYKAKTEEDMRSLYATLDRGRQRTRGDVIVSHLAGTPEFEGMPASIIKKLIEGYGLWKWPSQEERHRNDSDVVAYLMQSSEEGEKVLLLRSAHT